MSSHVCEKPVALIQVKDRIIGEVGGGGVGGGKGGGKGGGLGGAGGGLGGLGGEGITKPEHLILVW